jgi:hypothetical protein
MVRRIVAGSWIVAALVVASPAGAGQRPERRAVPEARADQTVDALPDAALADMLDTYAIVQAQRELTIADEKYGTFAARLKKLQDIRRRNQRQRQQLIRELVRMAGPRAAVQADETAIRAQLNALREHDDRAAAELRQAYDALDEVLDTRQQARFRMFEEQIERRKLDLLVRARARAIQKQ